MASAQKAALGGGGGVDLGGGVSGGSLKDVDSRGSESESVVEWIWYIIAQRFTY